VHYDPRYRWPYIAFEFGGRRVRFPTLEEAAAWRRQREVLAGCTRRHMT
jgi:hypothetical protein